MMPKELVLLFEEMNAAYRTWGEEPSAEKYVEYLKRKEVLHKEVYAALAVESVLA